MLTLRDFDISGVSHGFFTRQGGVSQGIYASLNCGLGSGDDPAAVDENRKRVAAHLGYPAEALITCHQAHTADVVIVDKVWAPADRPIADAMVTDRAGIVLGILTADCAPVLFIDPTARVIGAAHAGWKGAFGGVLHNTVARMVELGADRASIIAAIGPCIRQPSYEVGADFLRPFIEQAPSNRDYFVPAAKEGHFLFDLAGYVRHRIVSAGVKTVFDIERDTFAEAENFFSYRRTTLAGESDYGRELSALVLKG